MRRAFGLRPRLLAALVATSAVTLVVAALALLPPLRDRLRQQSISSTQAATDVQRPAFDSAVRSHDCARIGNLILTLRAQTSADVYVVDLQPASVCGFADPHAAGDLLVQRALNDGLDGRNQTGDALELVKPIGNHTADGLTSRYALIVRKTFSDVAGAVDEVYNAFAKAAIIGLAAAAILGLVLASTLVRRLERLRRAALRVTTEGAGAPRPHDEGSDEIGDLARSFAAMQRSLLAQEEARKAFVATASHELRTPLTSLSGMLELLDEDLTEGRLDVADAQHQIAAARRELRRLRTLAAELLDLSRLDAGVALRSEPVELGEIVRAVTSEFEQRAGDVGVEIDAVPPIGLCWAKGDPGAIARVVRILLDNALRFSPPGAPIRVTAHYSGEHAVIEVADAGPGVPEDERELVFKRFQRGSRTGGEGGFGLGLAIGRELAEKLGGSLTLRDTEAGTGACFVLELAIEMPAGGPTEPAPASVV